MTANVGDDELAALGWDTDESLRVGAWCIVDSLHPGEVKFVGRVAHAGGEWVGVALDAPLGEHDGSVPSRRSGPPIRYFRAKEDHGVLVRRSRIRITPRPCVGGVEEEEEERRTREEEESLAARVLLRFPIGTRVVVDGMEEGQVRFVGPTEFAGGVWVGVHLDVEGAGNCDGSVDGQVYFDSEEDRAVFVRRQALVRISKHRRP